MAMRHSRKKEQNSDNLCLLKLVDRGGERLERIQALADCGVIVRRKASSKEVVRRLGRAISDLGALVQGESDRQRAQNRRRNRRRKFR